jgi:Rps23 Pro-64 3,4-dihydroxylase Tpa1-like proline 4-hydroxylase
MDRAAIADYVTRKLEASLDEYKRDYQTAKPHLATRFVSIPSLLPDELAQQIYREFPEPGSMRRMASMHERKYTSKKLRSSPIVEACTFAFHDPRVVKAVEQITGSKALIPDERLYAGGISSMERGDYLHPHIDNSHDSERRLYRRLNLLYYVTPDWQVSNGGNLELWDDAVRERVTIPSSFNTLVIMETNKRSWHSVSEIRADQLRCCVSNYYFSRESPDGADYFHITFFSAPPEKPVRRALARVDGYARTLLRRVRKTGFARKDYY